MAKLQELSMQVLMGKYIVLYFHHGWNILRSRQLSASRDLPATTSRPEGRTKDSPDEIPGKDGCDFIGSFDCNDNASTGAILHDK